MKKYFGDIVLGLGILVLAGIVFYQQSPINVKGAGGTCNNVKQYLTVNALPYTNHSTGTTTQSNLAYVGTASTSYAFSTEGVGQVNFNLLYLTATTTTLTAGSGIPASGTTSDTALNLVYCYQYSDSATTTSDTQWFPITSNCATLTPGITSTSTLNVAVTSVNSKNMKIEFSSPISTSTRMGLWAEAILEKCY